MSLWKLLFGSKLGPQELSVGEILGRKLVKSEIKSIVNDVSDVSGEVDKKKEAEFNPVLGKLAFCRLIAKMASVEKRIHQKTAGGLLAGALNWGGMGLTMMGKSVAGRAAAQVAGNTAMSLGSGVQAARGRIPSDAMRQPRIAAEADRLIAMTKVGLEFHSHMQASTDTAEPIVKKKSLSKNSGLISAVSPGQTARGTSKLTSGLSSSTSNWLKRSSGGVTELVAGGAPGKQMAGMSAQERTVSAGAQPHIVRGH